MQYPKCNYTVEYEMSLLQGNFEALPEGKQGVVESQTVAIADDFLIRKMITLSGKEV